jgi:hypothetical protein
VAKPVKLEYSPSASATMMSYEVPPQEIGTLTSLQPQMRVAPDKLGATLFVLEIISIILK